MSYKSTRRQWVKLWVNEWLDGTTRFELTPQQRLLWIDLLALAGRSRFPGFIYAGEGQAKERVGYPIAYLAGVLQMDEMSTNNALKLLADHNHITLDETSPEKYVIGIVNWEKYQSEYLRQKTYRKVTTKTTSRLPVEVEVEGEKEEEVEITPSAMKEWSKTFPGVNLEVEISKATAWLKANPKRKKKNLTRFYFNWLSRCHSHLLEAEVKGRAIVMQKDELAHREARQGAGQHFEGTIKPESLERLRARRGMR